ncbi:MAG TPA: peptide-methionine (R)-S-oxide reductase MsrB [Candidatus Acidoferrales bacterium]|nr:peptide-methionine (R)-S-oxide reductase MsrB [Candidatus Acidoferrales bacterium]
MADKVVKSEDEWRGQLTPEQYAVCREKATERPFTGKYYHCKDDGTYRCVACGNPLFTSDTKYESGSGWPSFYQPVSPESVREEIDESHGMRRIEVMCGKCDAHLGHVFPDGPKPTGMRYCINSISLDLEKNDKS